MKKNAVVITTKDSIAVATVELKAGDIASMFIGDSEKEVTLIDDISFGHKIAISPVAKGEHVIKYGESIGLATQDIKVGEWVHVHNVESARGRGDQQ
ncbi:UxaA family hydrolase [Vibrio ezurae]|uniref:Putative D-galactarate dehydratase n=1 Tax=Vibrio ezurae NBRC 102218 TaxID=1219080 RepID=U3B4T7_9VIBR|nr:UxaA family hydrolase [Vibrio ezurae]GAD80955.1 putative D-galactarate dehydratase [Vibrio ezurae NBRC 102218]